MHGTQNPSANDSPAFALGRNNGQENAIFSLHDVSDRKKAQNRKGWSADRMSYTIDAATSQGIACSSPPSFLAPSRVRRLTPLECERLQGFPDNYTLIPWRGKSAGECPDGPRYRAIGNSMAVTVVRWVGLRILRQLV